MRKTHVSLLYILMALTLCTTVMAKDWLITDNDAVADGESVNSEAIQSLIDRVSAGGGGRVVVPAGTFVTGTIALKSNVELHLDRGAVLLGSLDGGDYYGNDRWIGMIIAKEQDNIAITGEGTLDGRGGAGRPRTAGEILCR